MLSLRKINYDIEFDVKTDVQPGSRAQGHLKAVSLDRGQMSVRVLRGALRGQLKPKAIKKFPECSSKLAIMLKHFAH